VPDEPLIPYKLFERVAGALLEVDAAPGDDVRAQLVLETPTGRRLLYRARARADATGVASLRVAYPTTSDGPVRALGPYTIHAGGHRLSAEVPEDAVRTGTVVRARTNQTR
jgi:hypothetical protein